MQPTILRRAIALAAGAALMASLTAATVAAPATAAKPTCAGKVATIVGTAKGETIIGTNRREMVYNKEKLLALGGTHSGVQKWKHKLEETQAQESFPVKP